MDGPQWHYTKWNKPDKKWQALQVLSLLWKLNHVYLKVEKGLPLIGKGWGVVKGGWIWSVYIDRNIKLSLINLWLMYINKIIFKKESEIDFFF